MTATETLSSTTTQTTLPSDAVTKSVENNVQRPRIIRKAGVVENYYQQEIERNGCINPATILFKSKIDLFANIELVNRAVRLWKRTQPFLRARIVKNEKYEDLQYTDIFQSPN